MGFLLNFSLKSHLLSFFDKKHKSTDWCSIEGGVSSDGENRVHSLYFSVFTLCTIGCQISNWKLPPFCLETKQKPPLFSWSPGIPESQQSQQNPCHFSSQNPTRILESRKPRIPESQWSQQNPCHFSSWNPTRILESRKPRIAESQWIQQNPCHFFSWNPTRIRHFFFWNPSRIRHFILESQGKCTPLELVNSSS